MMMMIIIRNRKQDATTKALIELSVATNIVSQRYRIMIHYRIKQEIY